MKFKIPSQFELGGLTIHISHVDKCHTDDDDDADGLTIYAKNLIELKNDKQAPLDYQEQTFCHEWIHHMLNYMGYDKLDKDEAFVNRLSIALYQSIKTME